MKYAKYIIIFALLGFLFFNYYHSSVAYIKNIDNKGPKIVTHFACNDYCPNSKFSYMTIIYEGVTDHEKCITLGGEIYTYSGWGETVICEV